MDLNVIFVSSEAIPFAKTGGLADVAGSLPMELKRLGCRVVLFLPLYREVLEKGVETHEVDLEVTVPLGPDRLEVRLYKAMHGDIPVYLVRRDEFFDRSFLYGTPEGDYFDNLERFSFFSRAVIESVKACGFKPDVIHCNDWQTGLIPAYLHDAYSTDAYFSKVHTVFTIHNLAYQGLFAPEKLATAGLSPALFTPEGVEFWGKINLLKAGVVYSDAITTVSRAYAREIQTPEYGSGLDGLLRHRRADLHGILNGVDYSEWNPETDPLIPARYSAKNMRGKSACRRRLLRELGLQVRPGTPVIGVVSRLAAQKGFDILCEAIPRLVKEDLAIAVLGSGERKYQTLIEELAARYPDNVAAIMGFDNRMAHLMEAGCDMLLMPSRYEPCGLNQIYSLKYGTIPVVRATGGLDDTVRDYGSGEPRPNGFKFEEYTAKALVEKVAEAAGVFKRKKEWKKLQAEAMGEDYSWHSSALKYIDLYKEVKESGGRKTPLQTPAAPAAPAGDKKKAVPSRETGGAGARKGPGKAAAPAPEPSPERAHEPSEETGRGREKKPKVPKT